MLNPVRDFVLVKEVIHNEEELTGLLDVDGNTVKKRLNQNNGTTRFGYVVAVGPTNEDVVKDQLVHFGAFCGTVVGFGKEDFILLQGLEVIMSEDILPYEVPAALATKSKIIKN